METEDTRRLKAARQHLQRLRNEGARAIGALGNDPAQGPANAVTIRQNLEDIVANAAAALREIEAIEGEWRERTEAVDAAGTIATPAGGAIPCMELVDQAWYFGHGRLGNVAQWFAKEQRFAVVARELGALVPAEMAYARGFMPRLRLA